MQPPNILTENYNCQEIILPLRGAQNMHYWEIHTRQIGIPVASKNSAAMGTFTNTNNINQRTVCKIYKCITWKVNALNIPSESVVVFVSRIWFY
jgi:hypothetical protein